MAYTKESELACLNTKGRIDGCRHATPVSLLPCEACTNEEVSRRTKERVCRRVTGSVWLAVRLPKAVEEEKEELTSRGQAEL